MMIGHKQSLNFFNMICSFEKPIHNSLLFYAFNPMDCREAIPLGEHGKTFQDFLLIMMQAIKNSPFILNENTATYLAF